MDFKVYNKEYFEGGGISGYNDYNTCDGIIGEWLYAVIKSIEHKPKRYLDVGCAYGFTVDITRRHNVDAWGVEPPTYAYDKSQEKQWGKYIIKDSLPELKELEGTEPFDLVTCCEVLEHIPQEDIKPSLIRMMELTTNYLVIMPNISTGPQIDKRPGHGITDITHISMLPKKWWWDLFKEIDIEKLRDKEAEKRFSLIPICEKTHWARRLFVFKKQ